MTTIRADPRKQRFPSLSGRLVLYARRGQLIVQAWPRKRGRPKSPITREQNEWFTAVNRLAKRADPGQQTIAIRATKGTGLYPRDLLIALMSGGMVDPIFPDGSVVQAARQFRRKIMFQGVILQLVANQALIPNVATLITWPLPVLDTAGFWNVAAPDRLTIPAGIEVVKINAGWGGVVSTPNQRQRVEIFKNGAFYRVQDGLSVSTPNQAVSSGADAVLAGDFFQVKLFCPIAQSAIAGNRTYFTLDVLQAT